MLRFVSLVLLSLVLGVEGQSPAVVDCRRSGGETRVEPLGHGEGRGDPHEIHVGRLQVLGQVLLVLRLGLLIDLAMGGGMYTMKLRQRGMFCSFVIDVGLFFLGCAADPVEIPDRLRKSGPDLFLVDRILHMTVVAASFLRCRCSSSRSVPWQCHIWS